MIRQSLYFKSTIPLVLLGLSSLLLFTRFIANEYKVQHENFTVSLVDNVITSLSLAAEVDASRENLQRILAALSSNNAIKNVLIITPETLEIVASKQLFIKDRNAFDSIQKKELNALLNAKQQLSEKVKHLYEQDGNWYAISWLYLVDPKLKRLRAYYLWVHIDTSKYEQQLTNQLLRFTLQFLVVISAIAAFSFWLLNYFVIKPLSLMGQTIREGLPISEDLIRQQSGDVISKLASSYNKATLQASERADQLKKTRHYIDGITQHVPVLLTYVDAQQKYRFANRLYCKLFNLTEQEIVGKTVKSVLPVEIFNKIQNHLHQALSGEMVVFEIDLELQKQRKYLIITYTPDLADDESVAGVFACIEDVTKLKQSEEQIAKYASDMEFNNWALEEAKEQAENASKAKADFLATMSHEIRTPMNGVLGMLDALQQSNLNTEQYQQVEIASRSAQSLMRIINDILDFSKIESGKLEIDINEFNLAKLIHETTTSFSKLACDKNIELILDINALSSPYVYSDSVRIKQILTNLISNAVKFTQRGSVTVHAEYTFSDENTSTLLKIQVIDTGIGFSAEKKELIFEHFSQADTSTTRQFGGTGLGLSIVKKLCELLGGEIYVESQPEFGSKFSVILPISISLEKGNHSSSDNLTRFTGSHFHFVNCHPRFVAASKEQLEKLDIAVHSHKEFDDLQRYIDGISLANQAHYFIFDWQNKNIAQQKLFISQHATQCVVLLPFNISIEDAFDSIDDKLKFCKKPATLSEVFAAFSHQVRAPQPRIEQSQISKTAILLERVLIVEDMPINQIVVTQMLKDVIREIEFADNGLHALNTLQSQPPEYYQLILMDCQMPVMDGYEATRRIRKREAGESIQHIPIIAMTANAMIGDKEKCLEAGMDDYISKPLIKDRLIEVLERFSN